MAQGRDPRALRWLCRKAPKLLDNNITTMRNIPTDNVFANNPLDVSTFITGRSLGIPALDDVAVDGIGRLRQAN